jgi:hypothetical protein
MGRIKNSARTRQEKPRAIGIKADGDIPPEQQPPYFSLRYLQSNHSVPQCNKDEKSAFTDTLHKLSQLTWAQIRSSHRHGCGYEKIGRDSFKVAIPDHITDDVSLIAFRFCAKAPMVGYRDGAIFYVIWIDRGFSVYKH